MKTLVVTTFNQRLYEEYAHQFWSTFPHGELDLAVYSETELPIPHRRLVAHSGFVAQNAHRPTRNWKLDAIRFCYKPFAMYQATREFVDYDRLLWIDADTHFHKPITESWIDEHLYKPNTAGSYMNRPNYHSETGVLLFNLHEGGEQWIEHTVKYYATGEIWNLQEQHDSYVWDTAREQLTDKYEFCALGPDYPVDQGHVQAYLYGEYFDHKKGKRKQIGYSKENTHR